MWLFPIVLAGAAAGSIIYRLFYRGRWWARGRTFCPVRHQVGPVTLRHEATAIDCCIAEEIAALAEVVWKRWLGRRDSFTLFVVFEGKRPAGGFRSLLRELVVNVAHHDCVEAVADTLAEELFHLGEALDGIVHQYVFKGPRCGMADSHIDLIRYYALNEHEYRALCFAVEVVGLRADLLKEVKQYRKEHGIGGG